MEINLPIILDIIQIALLIIIIFLLVWFRNLYWKEHVAGTMNKVRDKVEIIDQFRGIAEKIDKQNKKWKKEYNESID